MTQREYYKCEECTNKCLIKRDSNKSLPVCLDRRDFEITIWQQITKEEFEEESK